MSKYVSTGIRGLDRVIDMLWLGDNVVWQVDSLGNYREVVNPFIRQARADGRHILYIRFGSHEPVIEDLEGIEVRRVNAENGFEFFASEIHRIIMEVGLGAFYVFDCLTDLLKFWHSDLMIGNFFRVTCPTLFELETVAYFALIRDSHDSQTIGRIRDTTQLLLEYYNINGNHYVHPLKVWQRQSPTMFLPHQIIGEEVKCISASYEATYLFAQYSLNRDKMDYWDMTFQEAYMALSGSRQEKNRKKELLLKLLIGKKSGTYELCRKYLTLKDLIRIKNREIGTGCIGGKTVGMLLARKILESVPDKRFSSKLEMHDSFFLGADVFYTYIVQNGCWQLRMKQKTEEGYYVYAQELKERLLSGSFSGKMKEQFVQMLEYFGQSPIIVRSSSLLEDNFGNAFAGKYDSVFCANQGTPEERYEAFEQAVKMVYASTMNLDALNYRKERGLMYQDEQMAILIQRVSGDHYGDYFFPHLAGVGNSSNLYVWNDKIDREAGMLRLVLGLGTRAVDRLEGDYVRVVTLDDPDNMPPVSYGDERKFSQHYLDYIDTREGRSGSMSVDRAMMEDIHMDKGLMLKKDWDTSKRKRELGIPGDAYVIDFHRLFAETDFAGTMRDILKTLAAAYDYPVDMEFTVNFNMENEYRINLLQCRPLQTRGLGKSVTLPEVTEDTSCLFAVKGNFMGGNVHYALDYMIYIKPDAYLSLPEQERYGVARRIGMLNQYMKQHGKKAILIGPGRWGTTTTSLGVPVHFTELCHMTGIFEVSYKEKNLMPELSYGSHFFQDLVESGVFYGAIFNGDQDVLFEENLLTQGENLLALLLKTDEMEEVIQVTDGRGYELYADTVSQKMMCLCVGGEL